MEVKITRRAKWLGKVTLVPAYSGVFGGAGGPAEALEGIKVPSEFGDTTTVRFGEREAVVVSLGDRAKAGPETFRRAGGVAVKWLARREVAEAAVDARACEAGAFAEGLGPLCEGLVLGAFGFQEFKSEDKRPPVKKVELLVQRASKALDGQVERACQVAGAANLARELAHQPPNVINPVSLAARAKRLAAEAGLTCKILDDKEMKRLKMGALLAVGQGSETPPRLIVLEYRGKGGGKPVVLVGKAITFDTGGYSIKPRDGIVGMKYDKCGGAAVLGVMRATAWLKPRTPVVGIVAAAENMISGKAYRPDDIIRTMSGKTVEIVSADAEGRLVLCDALTYAQSEYKPRAIIDLATLTGGVLVALGKHRAGLFCNDDRLRSALTASGARTCELLWPMPLDDEYLEALKGTDSDLKNSGGRSAHAILGAMFLKQFIAPKVRWAHLDIAGVADVDKDQPYCPKGATGFGVRLLADYLGHVRA